MRSKPRADKCVLETKFVTLHGSHFRFTMGTWWPDNCPDTKFYLEIALESLEGQDEMLDILYFQDLNTLINRADDCYEMERQEKGYLASRPLDIFALTPVGARCEDGNVFNFRNGKGRAIDIFGASLVQVVKDI